MERAYLHSDASYDGVFFLGVRTTGIFCRPSCPARKPRPVNVEFFGTPRAALVAGYRPCKRCRPLFTDGRPPEWVARLLQTVEADPTSRIRDTDVRALGVDPARARRYFKRHFGMTFQAYNRARRLGTALTEIREGADLTNVGFDTGYDSTSGFREAFERTFGRPPGKARGAACIVTQMFASPLGPLLACATPEAICLLEFTDRRAIEAQVKTLRQRFEVAIVPGASPLLAQLRIELAEFFAGERQQFTVPLVYPGTPFQQAVWAELLRIPYGRTISYEELARRVGRPGAQRAVGMANGQNRIGIVIPCHRVVNKSGKLGGYGGGLWRKQFLLDLEGKTSGGEAPPAQLDLWSADGRTATSAAGQKRTP
jgi:AraC family transcriptional regulator, regulatory protein of adaptative response / methylated-DNA-[protein]-cysteine methyltransferase